MKCAKCGADNREGAKFCNECAAPIEASCPKCGSNNKAGAKFCNECGTSLGPSAAASPRKPNNSSIRVIDTTVAENLEGERKTVTMLFADIKGSMDLIEDLDPEEARAIVDPALKLMMEAVQRYGGYVAQPTGDGIFALFGAPVAHEDHPRRALLAALRMQEELKRYSNRIRAEGRLPIQARVGLNTGEVVMRSIPTGEGRTEYAPVGHSTGIAARMQALAPVGSIAATEQIRKLCEGYFLFKSLGPTKVKGVSEPVNVYEVTGLGPLRTRLQRAAARGYTKFVGREREMEALRRAAEQSKAGHGQIVAVMAEPGVGKSRLFDEFKIKHQPDWMVLEAFPVSHVKTSAYLPVIDLLHGYFRIAPDDDPRTRREKVNGRIVTLDPSLEDTRPYLFGLLGLVEGDDPLAAMDARIRRQRTLEALKRILLRESLNQPLMVVFEDLHWIDDETQAFLDLLADSIGTAKLLVMVNYRPEYSHQWGGKTYYTQLRLDPLVEESASEMFDALLRVNTQTTDAPLLALKQLIIEKTEGTPLFMEEIYQALIEEGALARNGVVKLTRPLHALKIPTTVQAILASRIDRLPAAEKDLLQTLSVIGIKFSLPLAREVVKKPDDELDQKLKALQLAEFIYEQPAVGEVEYTFKHALTHEVAYMSMMTERRRLLHERTGQAIEALYHERLEDQYAALAHHYRSSDNAAKSVEYLRKASEQAIERGVYAQVLANVAPALQLVERLPEGPERLRAELRVRLLEAMVAPALYGLTSLERLQICEQVCELSERLGDSSALLLGLANVGFVYLLRLELPRALEITRRCAQVVERNLNGQTPPYVQFLLANYAIDSGDLLQARSLCMELARISAHDEAATDFRPWNLWVLTPFLFAEVQLGLGKPEEAVKLSDEALRRGRELKDPLNLAVVTLGAALWRYYLHETRDACPLAEAGHALAEENGLRDWIAVGRWLRALATAELGQVDTVLDELQANITLVPGPLGVRMPALLARVCVGLGQPERALRLLDEALGKDERLGVHELDAELYRLRGEATLMRDSSATAEAAKCFRKAIEIARGQSAKWWELRAITSLARLLRDTDRRDEARMMLAEIYGWFTEGFDTADLKEAKTLLNELSA